MNITFNIPLHNLRSIAQVEEGLTNVGLLVSTERKMVSAQMTISTKDDDKEIDINTAFTIGQLVGQIQTMAMINQQPEFEPDPKDIDYESELNDNYVGPDYDYSEPDDEYSKMMQEQTDAFHKEQEELEANNPHNH